MYIKKYVDSNGKVATFLEEKKSSYSILINSQGDGIVIGFFDPTNTWVHW
jgi:hypothetical protein